MCKTGRFVKYGSNTPNILTFVPERNGDDMYVVLQELRGFIDKNINVTQCTDKNEIELTSSLCVTSHKYFETVVFHFFNYDGDIVKAPLKLDFDFDNNLMFINGRKFKVEKDNNFAYKVLKTKIKSQNGLQGLYKFILEAMHVDSVFNCTTYNMLENAITL